MTRTRRPIAIGAAEEILDYIFASQMMMAIAARRFEGTRLAEAIAFALPPEAFEIADLILRDFDRIPG